MQEAYISFNRYLHFSLPLQRDLFNPTSPELGRFFDLVEVLYGEERRRRNPSMSAYVLRYCAVSAQAGGVEVR